MKNKKKNIVIAILCAVLAFATVKVCSPMFMKQGIISVKFKQEAATDISYKIWWATSKDESFSSSRSVISKVNMSQKEVSIDLPTDKIARFRIDPTSSDVNVLKISDVRLHYGDSVYKFDNMEDFGFHVAKNIKVARDKESASFLCGLPVPKIVYQKDLSLESKTTCDWYLLFSVILISCLLYTYLGLRLRNTNKAWEKILFIIVFVCICCVPMSRINTAEVSKAEQRKLASFPRLLENKRGLNLAFGKQFEVWLQDRFAYRTELIKQYDNLKYTITGVKENKKAVKYANNWVFSKPYVDSVVHGYDKELAVKAVNNLQRLNNWCKERGIKLYLLVCPVKERVYADMNPRMAALEGIKVKYDINDMMFSLKDVTAIYPLSEARATRRASPETLLYFKQDTHFSEDGAHLFYRAAMAEIKKDFPHLSIMQKDDPRLEISTNSSVLKAEPLDNWSYEDEVSHYFLGDLGGSLALKAENYDVLYNHYTLKKKGMLSASRVLEPMQTRYTFSSASGKAVLLGESTTAYIRHWFKYSFGELLRIRSNNGVAENKFTFSRWEKQIEDFNPDLLIICLYESWLVANCSQLY
ncbi:MAG: hypothetical protein IKZ13_02930 [Akkermansia sp.]|nr:hypothetical protein [Akkermansia sp.]MBR5894481.1 hypothetical protein [Akkermansia sp.]